MSYARIDDLLPHHRKIMACGPHAINALGLYVSALAYCQRHHTNGVIPKEHASLLVPAVKRPPRKIIEALVRVGLWVDEGASWRIHDYLDWNDPAEVRSEKARQAARVRWGRQDATRMHAPMRGASPADASRIDARMPLLSSPLHSTPTPSALRMESDGDREDPAVTEAARLEALAQLRRLADKKLKA